MEARNLQQISQFVCSVPRQYDRRYTGETGRPLAVRLCEHGHNFKEGLLVKSKLAQCAYENGIRALRDEARVLKI
jgi:hypothetical protein